MLWLLELRMIVGIQDDTVCQGQSLGRAFSSFHNNHLDKARIKNVHK